MTPRTLVVSLSFLGLSCSSTTGEFTPPEDAAADVGQDVPPDMVIPARDVPAVDVPVGRDVVTEDLGRDVVDVTVIDRPVEDLPPADLPPADLPPADVPMGTCSGRLSPPDAVCGAAMCGNNRVDTCRTCGPCGPRPGMGGGGTPDAGPPPPPPPFDAGTCCTDNAESCDGTDLRGATCATLGYSGGTLGCGDTCGFDTSDCDVCARGSSIVQCGRVRVATNAPRDLALAAIDGRVGLAWVGDPLSDGSGGALGVAVLFPTLEIVRSNPCLGSGVRHVALAATPRGWILAAENARGVDVYALDAMGELSGAPRSIAGAHAPLLSGSPDGRTLLAYTFYGTSSPPEMAVVLDASARPLSPATPIVSNVTEPEYGSAVYTPSGWLVAMREVGVIVVRVGLDGRASPGTHPTSNATEYPQVGWNGMFATLTWSDFGSSPGGVRYGRLDTAGNLVGSPLVLGSIPAYFNVAPTVSIGSDTVVLLGGYTGGTGRSRRLDLQRVSALGATTGALTALTAGPETHVKYRIAALGSDVVTAWLSADGVPGRITLARVHP